MPIFSRLASRLEESFDPVARLPPPASAPRRVGEALHGLRDLDFLCPPPPPPRIGDGGVPDVNG